MADAMDSTPQLRLENRSRSLREDIAAVLEKAIITGVYQPGQRLVERELTENFGVSSIPVREALQDLEARGLVVKRHNYGCTVVKLTPEDLRHICNLRSVLEPRVIAWAAQNIDDERLKQLRQQYGRMMAAAEAGDFPSFFHEDMVFHKMIWDASGNRFAVKALESVMGSLFAAGLSRSEGRPAVNLIREVKKHEELLRALERRNAAAAATALSSIAEGFETHVAELKATR
jgi:DNA-binding GntR family transcriptional regulator